MRPAADPDALEVAAGFEHEHLEGWVPDLQDEAALCAALEKAFDYRGDVTLTLRDGRRVVGYVFDRSTGATLRDSIVRILPANGSGRVKLTYADIVGLEFSGKDTASGKSFESWVARYFARKAAGETGIGIEPEPLD